MSNIRQLEEQIKKNKAYGWIPVALENIVRIYDCSIEQASLNGCHNIVELCLKANMYTINTLNTSLCLATQNNYIECVKLLLKAGAYPKVYPDFTDVCGISNCAIGLACRGNPEILKILLHYIDPSHVERWEIEKYSTIAALNNKVQCFAILEKFIKSNYE